MANERKMYEIVADKIIEQLKEGVAPWQKPWNSAGTNFIMPFNAVKHPLQRLKLALSSFI